MKYLINKSLPSVEADYKLEYPPSTLRHRISEWIFFLQILPGISDSLYYTKEPIIANKFCYRIRLSEDKFTNVLTPMAKDFEDEFIFLVCPSQYLVKRKLERVTWLLICKQAYPVWLTSLATLNNKNCWLFSHCYKMNYLLHKCRNNSCCSKREAFLC